MQNVQSCAKCAGLTGLLLLRVSCFFFVFLLDTKKKNSFGGGGGGGPPEMKNFLFFFFFFILHLPLSIVKVLPNVSDGFTIWCWDGITTKI